MVVPADLSAVEVVESREAKRSLGHRSLLKSKKGEAPFVSSSAFNSSGLHSYS